MAPDQKYIYIWDGSMVGRFRHTCTEWITFNLYYLFEGPTTSVKNDCCMDTFHICEHVGTNKYPGDNLETRLQYPHSIDSSACSFFYFADHSIMPTVGSFDMECLTTGSSIARYSSFPWFSERLWTPLRARVRFELTLPKNKNIHAR